MKYLITWKKAIPGIIITIPIIITGKIADMDVRYKFVDANGNIVSQSTQSIKPDMSEVELIRKLTSINECIQEDKHGLDLMFYDLK